MGLLWPTLASGLISSVVAAIVGALVLLYIDWRDRRRVRQDAIALCRIVYVEVVSNLVLIRESARQGVAPPTISVSAWRSNAGRIAYLLAEKGLAEVASAYLLVDMHRDFFSQGGLDLLQPRLRGLDAELLNRLAESFVRAEQILGDVCWSQAHRLEFRDGLAGYIEPVPRRPLVRRLRAALAGFSTGALLRVLAFLILTWEMERIADAIQHLSGPRCHGLRADPPVSGGHDVERANPRSGKSRSE